MAPIGSVLKNTLVYILVMGAGIFISVNFFLFNGLANMVRFANGNNSVGNTAITQVFFGLLIIFSFLGLALNLTLPSIVGDELVEF